jgi:hypothetical protein
MLQLAIVLANIKFTTVETRLSARQVRLRLAVTVVLHPRIGGSDRGLRAYHWPVHVLYDRLKW